MTGRDLVTAALRMLNVVGEGDTPTATEANDGLVTLQEMLDGWAAQNLTMHRLLRTLKTLTSGTSSYTLGTGGDINIVRPDFIDSAGLIIDTAASPVVELPIEIFTNQRWAAIRIKLLSSALVQGIFYDYGWSAGLGTVFVYPVPNVGTTQLVLYTPVAITGFADLSTDYTYPPAYRRALRFNLAVDLAPEYKKTPSALIVEKAAEYFGDLQRANLRPAELRVDDALQSRTRGFNYYTGEPL